MRALEKSRFLNWKRSGFVDRTRKSTVERFYQAINGIASGKSLTKAAKDAHISIATSPFHWPVNGLVTSIKSLQRKNQKKS